MGVLFLGLIAAACGQKGPLRLADQQAVSVTVVATPTPVPTPTPTGIKSGVNHPEDLPVEQPGT